VNQIEKIDIKTNGDASFSDQLKEEVENYVHETLTLENGAEAYFMRSSQLSKE